MQYAELPDCETDRGASYHRPGTEPDLLQADRHFKGGSAPEYGGQSGADHGGGDLPAGSLSQCK